MDSKSTDKKHLTDKQIRYLTARIDGKTRTEAKKIANYSPNMAPSQIERNPNLRAALLVAMESKGITESFLADKLKNGMESKKVIYSTSDGQITDMKEVPDNETQHKFFRDTLEIRGDVKNSAIESLNIGVVQMPSQSDDNSWNDVSTLDSKQEVIDKSIEQK